MFPATANKVEKNTAAAVNNRINSQMNMRIHQYYSAESIECISHRLSELDEEWDTERVLETSAAVFVLIGLFMGYSVNPLWHWFSGLVAGFLLLHALQGWCPPLPIIRRMGIRSANEINRERMALLQLKEYFRDSSQTEPSSDTWYH